MKRYLMAFAVVATLSFSAGACVNAQQSPPALLSDFVQQSEIMPGESYNVLRMEVDLTGDGVPELLLAKALPNGRSGEQEWFAYSNLGNQQYRRLGIMDFSFLLFRLDAQGKLLVYDTGLQVMVTYQVDSSGFHEVSRQSGVVAGGAEWQKFADWRKSAGLRVLSADLNDLQTNASPTWTDVLTQKPVAGVGPLTGVVIQ